MKRDDCSLGMKNMSLKINPDFGMVVFAVSMTNNNATEAAKCSEKHFVGRDSSFYLLSTFSRRWKCFI
jgi:hypothetical protein